MELSGIVLAGGESRRMGVNKAMLEIEGVPVIAHVSSQLSGVAKRVMISCSERDSEEYRFLGLPIITDLFPELGPLGGVHAGLTNSRTEWNAVVACDLPFASGELLRYMLTLLEGAERGTQAILPVSAEGKVQPLLALYHKSVLPSLEQALIEQRSKVMDWLKELNVIYVPEAQFPKNVRENGLPNVLLNMNTPEDYLTAVRGSAGME